MTTVEVLPLPDLLNYGDKQCRVIRLVNQMKVLLVHDDAIHAGFSGNSPTCGLAVSIGSLSDPPDIPGLAEFVGNVQHK